MTLREVERDAVQMGRRWLHDLLFADWGLKTARARHHARFVVRRDGAARADDGAVA